MKKILYVRSGPYQVDPNSYNLQEIGLARALYELGYQCDIVYYHKSKNFDQSIIKNGVEINILWRHGIRILRSGIYPSVLKKDFLKNYDYVICSEYSQIMSVLLCKKFENTYIYNGPYYNLFKIPIVEKIYDKLFCKYINKKAKKVFCKTKMSEEYINKKGITNTVTVGVGLDTEKFDNESEIKTNTKKILEDMNNHRNLLYIGSIIKRKNVEILIKAFVEAKKEKNAKDLQLVLIGKGDKNYTDFCHSLVPESLKKDVIWCEYIENAQTKFIFQAATAFLLPSTKEIFGMVLLEAMYFGIPVISSHSAGADTLIYNNKNGIILENFEIDNWKKAIINVINNKEGTNQIGNNAKETIINNYMWNCIGEKMCNFFEK